MLEDTRNSLPTRHDAKSLPAGLQDRTGFQIEEAKEPGAGGDSHIKQTGMLAGNFEVNP